MKTATMNRPGRPRYKTLCRVEIRLCSCRANCGDHEHWTEPLDARRDDSGRSVTITQPHPVWFGAVVKASEFRFAE